MCCFILVLWHDDVPQGCGCAPPAPAARPTQRRANVHSLLLRLAGGPADEATDGLPPALLLRSAPSQPEELADVA
jgi:hypothetical protein